MLMLIVFAVGTLVCCWVWGDQSLRAKGATTALYVASWGLLLAPSPYHLSFALAQALFAIVVGGMTFGVDWIMRDSWHVR